MDPASRWIQPRKTLDTPRGTSARSKNMSADNPEDDLKTKVVVPLDEDDIALLKTYVRFFALCEIKVTD